MSIKDFPVTASSVGLVTQELFKLFSLNPDAKYRLSCVKWRESRSLSQNSLLWKWYGEIAIQASSISKDPEIWHEIFKKYYCPCKIIEVPGGQIEIKSTKKLDVGEMYYYLNRIEQYCIDRGYSLTIPESCEYNQLRQKQEV